MIHVVYRQKSGRLTLERQSGEFSDFILEVGRGYSGKGQGRDNPDLQARRNVGPIPIGRWSIGAPFDHPSKGPRVFRLEARPETETYGRSGFLVHGDNASGNASSGCIILGPSQRQHLSFIVASGIRTLTVIRE